MFAIPTDVVIKRFLNKVGASLEEVLQTRELSWNCKRLGSTDAVVVANVVEYSAVLMKLQ